MSTRRATFVSDHHCQHCGCGVAQLVDNVPESVLNADLRLFSDEHIPELVRDLMRELWREGKS